MRRWLWIAGWEVLRVVVGLPAAVLIGVWDGLGDARRVFAATVRGTWRSRARAGEGSDLWNLRQQAALQKGGE